MLTEFLISARMKVLEVPEVTKGEGGIHCEARVQESQLHAVPSGVMLGSSLEHTYHV